ncbi:DUF4912 domain-containing protein [Neobacillus muris]|uniref:DUF4912 domain-containing protein n=1 Tax=Neobacillus muris TaxID=2941334 RepID=UPI00203E2915|nr:DUF4912 domain-containing protein [Neobacillus muris]
MMKLNKINELAQLKKKEEPSVYSLPPHFEPPINEIKMRLVSPDKIALFWDTTDLPKKIIQSFFCLRFDDLITVIRIYDVTDINFNGNNAHHFYELAIPYQNGCWLIKGLSGNRWYLSEIGVYLNEKQFFPFFRSGSIQLPNNQHLNAYDSNHELPQVKQANQGGPNWRDYVSTYSYYRNREGNHD